jgi:hypothetical protein
MQFTKFASLSVIFFVALFGLVAANPVERAASTDAQILAQLTTLHNNIQSPIASISTCPRSPHLRAQSWPFAAEKVSNSSHPTTAVASPFVSEIIVAFTSAHGQLRTIKASGASKRQSNTDVADQMASIVSEVTSATALLGGTKADSIVSSLLPGLDSALDAVLTDLENLLAGVLDLVAQL